MLMKLTHANLKQPIEVAAANYFTCYYSETQKCTLLLSIGTTVIPVLESKEQVKEAYEQAVKGVHVKEALQNT